MKIVYCFLFAVLLIAGSLDLAWAGQMRRFDPIASPGATAAALPEDARPVEEIQPVENRKIADAFKKLADTWNSADIAKMIDDDFFDKSRLKDAMADKSRVPSDATLRVLSVRDSHTLQQMIREAPDGNRTRISIVEVTAATQVEFNDIDNGFVRLQGTNAYILQVKEPIQ